MVIISISVKPQLSRDTLRKVKRLVSSLPAELVCCAVPRRPRTKRRRGDERRVACIRLEECWLSTVTKRCSARRTTCGSERQRWQHGCQGERPGPDRTPQSSLLHLEHGVDDHCGGTLSPKPNKKRDFPKPTQFVPGGYLPCSLTPGEATGVA